jgi:hypothetical protein
MLGSHFKHQGASAADAREDSLVTYTASGGIIDLEVGYDALHSGTGTSSVTEKYCLGEATALPCTSGGTPGTIAVSDPPLGFTSHTFFSAQTLIGVSKDIFLDSERTGRSEFRT